MSGSEGGTRHSLHAERLCTHVHPRGSVREEASKQVGERPDGRSREAFSVGTVGISRNPGNTRGVLSLAPPVV